VGRVEVVTDAAERHVGIILSLPFFDTERIRSRSFRVCLDTVNGKT
jgi:hypothetical protein